MTTPLCFILMPFGRKAVGAMTVDFDQVHAEVIAPAVADAELRPLRADEERAGGIIHKQMFERLVLCDYAVADLTGANANVFYELGIRHGTRPRSTVLVFAEGMLPPFDLGPMRAVPYRLGPDGKVADAPQARARLADALRHARENAGHDSPLWSLLQGFPELDHSKTDVFRDQVEYSERIKAALRSARHLPDEAARLPAIRAVEDGLPARREAEAGVLVDLLLSYRAVDAHEEMLRLIAAMPPHLSATVLVQEQRGFALNRVGRHAEARAVLEEMIARRGPTPETCGLLGRVFKDLRKAQDKAGNAVAAAAMLDRAIETYRAGFEADWRDAYPGVNLIMLLAERDPADPELATLLPVVRYAVERKIAGGRADYWDHATRLELAVIARDERAALRALGQALGMAFEPWMADSTAETLERLHHDRTARGETCAWIAALAAELRRHGARKG